MQSAFCRKVQHKKRTEETPLFDEEEYLAKRAVYMEELRKMRSNPDYYKELLEQLRTGTCLQYRLYYDYLVEGPFSMADLGSSRTELVQCALRCNAYSQERRIGDLMLEQGLRHALERELEKAMRHENVLPLVPVEEAA